MNIADILLKLTFLIKRYFILILLLLKETLVFGLSVHSSVIVSCYNNCRITGGKELKHKTITRSNISLFVLEGGGGGGQGKFQG